MRDEAGLCKPLGHGREMRPDGLVVEHFSTVDAFTILNATASVNIKFGYFEYRRGQPAQAHVRQTSRVA